MASSCLHDNPDRVHNDVWLVDQHGVTGLFSDHPGILVLTAGSISLQLSPILVGSSCTGDDKVDSFAKTPVRTKTEAVKTWLPKFVTAVMESRYPQGDVAVTRSIASSTVSEFLKEYRKRHCEAEKLNLDSLSWKPKVIDRRFGALPLNALEKPGPIEDFKADMVGAGKTHATINRYLAQLKHMINWAIGRELMVKNPFFHKTRNPTGIRLLKGEGKRRRRVYPSEEKTLLDACDVMNTGAHDYVGAVMKGRIIAAIDLGLRRGEMLKIRNHDINWKGRPVPVLTIQWGNAKSRKEREIPLTSARVLRFLKSRRLVGGAEGFPFGSAAGERVQNFRKAWETLLRLSRITDPEEELDGDLHWHDLRHECGSRYADRGLDGRHIQMLLGHSDLKTTERYLNSDTKRLAEAMKEGARKVGPNSVPPSRLARLAITNPLILLVGPPGIEPGTP